MTELKWLEVRISAVDGVAIEDGPAWKYLQDNQRKENEQAYGQNEVLHSPDGAARTSVGGGVYVLTYNDDDPTVRVCLVKTNNHEAVREVVQFDGVTCNDVTPSGYWSICGFMLNEAESKETDRLFVEEGREASNAYFQSLAEKYNGEVWPGVKAEILDTITRIEPEALRHTVDVEHVKVIVLYTYNEELLNALNEIDHSCLEEIPPGVGPEKVQEVVDHWIKINDELSSNTKEVGN